MTWTELDWKSLDGLRAQFLDAKPKASPYWKSAEELAQYDLTFGERIGWKWDAVLEELRIRGWTPPSGTVLDWGCGSGIAGRRAIGHFGQKAFKSLVVWDHSPIAGEFARSAAGRDFHEFDVQTASPGFLKGGEPIGLLLISHVLNELQPSGFDDIRALAARSASVIWTEPGTHETSRALGRLRDELLGDFRAVAPCTHSNECPILASGNERHWCHHFAFPPPAIFADSNWVKFGQRAGIDLRSLPYSFIALDRTWEPKDPRLSRVVGRPEHFKPYVRLLNCDSTGLEQLQVMKRGTPDLYKELDRTRRPLVYQWTREGATITGGTQPQP